MKHFVNFNKKNLKSGMIVKTRGAGNAIVVGNVLKTSHQLEMCCSIFASLIYYKEDMTCDDELFDIMEVYEIVDGWQTLSNLINKLDDTKLKLIWKRDKNKVDWSKVEQGTPIKVSNGGFVKVVRYFVSYLPYSVEPIVTTTDMKYGKVDSWKYGELIEEE